MAFHSLEQLGSNHAIHFVEYADAATREADTSLSSNDVKKIALQTDDNSYWLLLDTTPTWQEVGGANPLTTKGDLFAYDTDVTRLPVGTDTYVLTADSLEATGLKWAQTADQTPLTTKGDLFAYTTVDARLAVGTDGQVLVADSTQATGLKWDSGAPVTTKGDIFTFDTDNQRLAVGTDGQVLQADAAEATGIKWADVQALLGQTDFLYFGTESTDGSWRIGASGADLVVQKREAGTWNTKLTVTS